MTLGLPWWAWIPLACSAGLAHMTVACFGQLARRRHLLTCRVYWQLRAVVHTASCFTSNDCEHGPTKRWAGSAIARMLRWRKVAVNPDFAPA